MRSSGIDSSTVYLSHVCSTYQRTALVLHCSRVEGIVLLRPFKVAVETRGRQPRPHELP